jgi:uracil-DNA glycosylase
MPEPAQSSAPFVPQTRSLAVLREAVQESRGCDLYRNATQAVVGEMDAAGTMRSRARRSS